MKKAFIFITFLCLYVDYYAQDIVYHDFEPDIMTEHDTDSITIDFDNDGISDVSLVIVSNSTGYTFGLIAHGGWQISYVEDEYATITLTDITEWYNPLSWDPYFYQENLCVRKVDANCCYYGWFRAYNGYITFPNGGFRSYIGLDKYAYCTIPDYPLRWGQTELSTGVGENSEGVFAVYPNPAKQSVTLIGQQIAEARLYSVTGQLVATKQGNGTESLTMEVSGLPSGLYFVAAIGEDGSRSVLKVVKE